MGGIVDAIGDLLENAWDAVKDFVVQVWDEICMPILEEVFSWFGITDEDVVETTKISNPIFLTQTDDAYQDAIVKAVLKMPKNDAGFFRNYMQEVYYPKAQMKGYYRAGEVGPYINGLPSMTIRGGNMDFAAVETALETEFPGIDVLASELDGMVDTTFPKEDVWYKNVMQATPYFYKPWLNTLTYPDQNGDDQTDWTFDSVTYQVGNDTWNVGISHYVVQTLFWITGPTAIREGQTRTYTVHCNRTVPAGATSGIDVALVYGGTAVDGTDYTAIASVNIPASSSSVDFDIVTIDDGGSGNETLTISLGAITDTDKAFEYREVDSGLGSVSIDINDNDGIRLSIPQVFVDETAGTATVNVILEEATTGSFTVDVLTQNGTAVAGVDYTYTNTNKFFNGTAGETVNISVPILTGDGDDDNEYFEVKLANCTDGSVNATAVGKVFIRDYTDTGPPQNDNYLVSDVVNFANYISERYLIARYRDINTMGAGEWYYWLYRIADGTYPDIDPTSSYISNLDMMPIAILRHDKVNIDATPTSDTYKTTRLLMNRIGMDLQDTLDAIADNPNINDIDEAYINFSISPNIVTPAISKILYWQWKVVIIDYAISSNLGQYSATIEEGAVNNAMAWTDHGYTLDNVGSVCPVGQYIHSIVDDSDADGAFKKLVMQYQKASGLYDEMYVSRLNQAAMVAYGGFWSMAVNTCDGVDEAFTIPISYFILDQLPIKDLVQAYPHMVRLDFYAIQIIHLEWYETSAFLDLFTFVMIIVTIWTAGAAGGILAAIQQLAINYLIIELVIWVAELTGNEVLAAVVGIVAAIALGNAGAMPAFDFSSATDLIEMSTKFADNLTAAYEPGMEQLQQDWQELNKAAESRLEEIEKANEDATGGNIDVEWYVQMRGMTSNYMEAISAQYDFDQIYSYDRLITNFHDNRLRLDIV